MTRSDTSQQPLLHPSFGEHFLEHHAGSIISDSRHALIELVANAWDAGATRVEIAWPDVIGQRLEVRDNGSGMSSKEFKERWTTLNYSRMHRQGPVVQFPPGTPKRHRLAFGRNGVGRHAMFCFARRYVVDTVKDRRRSTFEVSRAPSGGRTPFVITACPTAVSDRDHGTILYTDIQANPLPLPEIIALVGSRFVADPEFRIFVNGEEITLTHLEERCERDTLLVPSVGELIVRRYDNEQTGRTSRQCGVAWWVNRRLVGSPSWDVLDGPLLDARGVVGRRFTYVIEADPLAGPDNEAWVKEDWSGFHTNVQVTSAKRAVNEFVRKDLRLLLADLRRDRKRGVLENTRETLRSLSIVSQEHVAQFADEVLKQSPTISERDLDNAVTVLATLEKSRSGYQLLEKLAHLSPDDIDGLDAILDEWSVSDARKVLDELRYRLRLIKQLEGLVEEHTTDELHDLQPLFARGLWIFGPEFEAVSFTSNRTLSTIVRQLLGGESELLTTPRKRPDFVALPNKSIGVYTADAFDDRHEVAGLARVVVLELKRGGFDVTAGEKTQALHYARELRRAGRVARETPITCYVLGSTIEPLAEEPLEEGRTTVLPRRYQAVLGQAHARTFRLLQAVENSKAVRLTDPELAEVLGASPNSQEELPLASISEEQTKGGSPRVNPSERGPLSA